tara:strand:- start:828 stop:1016 length:189 start_codon:yes stop_codon:yes gene_type:complete
MGKTKNKSNGLRSKKKDKKIKNFQKYGKYTNKSTRMKITKVKNNIKREILIKATINNLVHDS